MSIQDRFEEATRRAKSLPKQSNEVLLELYGLYKQATEGDVSGDPPGMFDFVGKAKHDAWAARKGLSKEAAMQAYADRVAELAG